MIARHAQANGVPEALVHRVVIRESRYNAHIVGAGGAMGLMQIKLGTAREMGYTGTAAGLLDPETNLTYAVRYLAGAYRVAGGNADRAVANYARGYRDTTVREGAAPARSAASAQASGWSEQLCVGRAGRTGRVGARAAARPCASPADAVALTGAPAQDHRSGAPRRAAPRLLPRPAPQ